MGNSSRTNATAASDAAHGEVIGVGYFRIPAPQIEPPLDFYGKTFAMKQIGCINVVAKFLDPSGNRIELIEEGSDEDENLYLIGKG